MRLTQLACCLALLVATVLLSGSTLSAAQSAQQLAPTTQDAVQEPFDASSLEDWIDRAIAAAERLPATSRQVATKVVRRVYTDYAITHYGRDSMLSSLARALATADQPELAIRVAERIPTQTDEQAEGSKDANASRFDDFDRMLLYDTIARAYERTGNEAAATELRDKADAFGLDDNIRPPRPATNIQLHAVDLALTGKYEEATELVASFPNDEDRLNGYIEIAKAQHAAGGEEGATESLRVARDIAENFSGPFRRERFIHGVARGDTARAGACRFLAAAMMEMDQPDAAAELLRLSASLVTDDIRELRAQVLRRTCITMVELHFYEDAQRHAARIAPDTLDRINSYIVAEIVEDGEFDQAWELAQSITHPVFKSLSASSLAPLAEGEQREALFQRAVDAIAEIEDEEFRDWPRQAMAIAHAKAGDDAEAIRYAARMVDSQIQSDGYEKIIDIWIENRTVETILANIAQISTPRRRADAYILLAKHQAETGHASDVVKWVDTLEDPGDIAAACHGAIVGLAGKPASVQ